MRSFKIKSIYWFDAITPAVRAAEVEMYDANGHVRYIFFCNAEVDELQVMVGKTIELSGDQINIPAAYYEGKLLAEVDPHDYTNLNLVVGWQNIINPPLASKLLHKRVMELS